MAVFRYRMQSILNIKVKMETQAKQEFAVVKLALDAQEEKLVFLQDRKKKYENEARGLLSGGLLLQDIIENKSAILRMMDMIEEQMVQVRLAEHKLEQARQRLQEVMQERKTHEKLREKAFDEFLQEEKQRESKEIDQLTSYTYGRKAGER